MDTADEAMCCFVLLPPLYRNTVPAPDVCDQCGGSGFRVHQQVTKPVKDIVYTHVVAARYQCLRCGRTIRMYPAGVTQAHTSERLRTLAAWLYLVGMSYGTVAEVLDAWRVYLCKSRVHDAVQSVLMLHPGLERGVVLSDVRFVGARMQTVLAQYGPNTLSLELVTSEDDAWVELQSPAMAPQQVSSMVEALEAPATSLGLHVIMSHNRLVAKSACTNIRTQ